MKKEIYNILFCGVGGQGVLTGSEVCSIAAMLEGFHVKKSEIKGMSQRGGSVESNCRFGTRVYSPLIPPGQVDILVCSDPSEGERLASTLQKEGVSFLPYLTLAEKKLADPKFLNTFLLGILSTFLPIKRQNWLDALQATIPYNIEQNKEVFGIGAKSIG